MTTIPQDPLARELYEQIATWSIYDPHSHIDAHRPAARSFDEILDYHYYTGLAHSAGMPVAQVAPELEPRSRVRNLAAYLNRLDNTAQYGWLQEIARIFHDFEDQSINPNNIDALHDRADHTSDGPAWDKHVWGLTNLEAVFLTNEFDDPLDGWDRDRYVPCLRTDDLVLKLHETSTRQRLQKATNIEVVDYASLRLALGKLFSYFVEHGARACAISLPPDFAPIRPGPRRSAKAVRRALHGLELRPDEHQEIRQLVFWTLAELCADFFLPFSLMIGPIRNVYRTGVKGGCDLFDRRVSLYPYQELFNHFAGVTFPISTLSPDAAAELIAYSWIFPNVVPLGHWWYSNVPAFIVADLKARLQALPKIKQVGYYSDAYKLEFILPKFNMYRRILAKTLADDAIRERGWTTDQALEVAQLILQENPRRIFAQPRA